MEAALPNPSLLLLISRGLCCTKEFLCSNSLPSDFLPLQSQNKQRVFYTDTTKHYTFHSDTWNELNLVPMQTFSGQVFLRPFMHAHNLYYSTYIVEEQHPGYICDRDIYSWCMIHPPAAGSATVF